MALRHPNILQFLGANTLDDRPFVVMPLIPHNAREFLRTRPAFDPVYILRDISLGLKYLHSLKICHGDLKGINVLVEGSGRALLCDFGLSRLKADITSRTRVPAVSGSRNWMAPEILLGSLPRIPSDIYAFGMTLYELYTDEIPMSTVPIGDFIELVFKLGVRPDRPDEDEGRQMSDDIWALAERCWVKDPKARPTATQIHDTINIILGDIHDSAGVRPHADAPRQDSPLSPGKHPVRGPDVGIMQTRDKAQQPEVKSPKSDESDIRTVKVRCENDRLIEHVR
ncbi:kinase-like domain-containing protein [Mycena leptocephala]|nr:kinase-like domain-containing protein [Mycena leptocephala]